VAGAGGVGAPTEVDASNSNREVGNKNTLTSNTLKVHKVFNKNTVNSLLLSTFVRIILYYLRKVIPFKKMIKIE
jgi:hypothetical protein